MESDARMGRQRILGMPVSATAKLGRSLMFAACLALMPSAAFAVSVSANDGSGVQDRVRYYQSNGHYVDVSGTLKSTSGKTVYYSGKVARGGCVDLNTGRYSTNTSSLSSVTRGGTMFMALTGCTFQGVKSRVCTVRNNFPDACGSDSSTY